MINLKNIKIAVDYDGTVCRTMDFVCDQINFKYNKNYTYKDIKNWTFWEDAGYEKDLNECFFAYNDGLDSRFTWRFKIDDYTAEDLRDIFTKKVKDFGWSIHENEEIKAEWFEKHMKYFKYYGRDMETLFSKTKIAHSRRVFCKPENVKTKITMKDLENGFEMYSSNDEVKKRADKDEIKVIQNMYL